DKFIHGADIPSGGLKQSMFYGYISLRLHGLLRSLSLYQDGITNYISTYFIFKAIEDCYPNAINCIFKLNKHLLLKMPQLNILSSQIMKHCNMGPILFNKNITNGTYEVIDTIFQHQLKFNKNIYSNRLFLIYDNQKTA